jgi:hypothetical protein
MPEPPDPDPAREQYWRFMEQLKAASIYARLYRDRLHGRVRIVDLIKAIAGNSAIAAWAVVQKFPFVWSAIIAASQLLDAIKGVFPFATQHKQAANLSAAMDLLMLDAEDGWQKLSSGAADPMIATLQRLRRLQTETEQKFFPDGLATHAGLTKLASEQAKSYLQQAYPRDSPHA